MTLLLSIALLVAGYLLGSIPSGYLAGRWLAGLDIRQEGSGSTGATNVLRVLGKGPALAVFLVDVGKGAAAVLLAKDYEVLEVSLGLQGGRVSETVFRPIPKDGLGCFRDISQLLKERVSNPVILTGGLREVDKAEELITNRDADLIGMCRPFVRQPALIRRWLQGDTNKATCTSCNGCVTAIGKGQPLACQLDMQGLTIDPRR